MFCYKCGTPVLEDEKFCHKCGTRLSKEKLPSPESPQLETASERTASPKLESATISMPVTAQEIYDSLSEKAQNNPKIKAVYFNKPQTVVIVESSQSKYHVMPSENLTDKAPKLVSNFLKFPRNLPMIVYNVCIAFSLLAMGIILEALGPYESFLGLYLEDYSLILSISLMVGGFIEIGLLLCARKETNMIWKFIRESLFLPDNQKKPLQIEMIYNIGMTLLGIFFYIAFVVFA